MPATFFMGDPHFGHELVSGIRGFSSVEEHDQAIARQWRKQVKPDDFVYVMGDLSSGGTAMEERALRILEDLPGRKRLISGNHDSVSGLYKAPSPNRHFFNDVFERINDYGHISLNRQQIILSHYPYWESGDGPGRGAGRYKQWRLPDNGNWLIHAHSHYSHPTQGSVTGREICVSWDAWRRLADIGDIARIIKG